MRIKSRSFMMCLLLFCNAGAAQIPDAKKDDFFEIKEVKTSDLKATPETKKLFFRLEKLRKNFTIFGHMDDLAYGNGWRAGVASPKGYVSDIFNTCGDYPGVFGWDLGQIERTVKDPNFNTLINGVNINELRRWVKKVHQSGGINYFTWHADNPMNGADSWNFGDKTVVCQLLDVHSATHKRFVTYLDQLANFFLSLKAEDGTLIPVIFRPFMEANMVSCYWWNVFNNSTCMHDEYRQLWRFTADYLKFRKGVHNVLYAFTINDNCQGYHFEMDYSIADDYPGNDYVDIIGFDVYFKSEDNKNPEKVFIDHMKYHSKFILDFCEENRKIPAVTETGMENFTQLKPWTGIFDQAFGQTAFAFILMWRNPDRITDMGSYFTVYPDHPSAPDFRKMYQENKRFVFQKKLKQYLSGN